MGAFSNLIEKQIKLRKNLLNSTYLESSYLLVSLKFKKKPLNLTYLRIYIKFENHLNVSR